MRASIRIVFDEDEGHHENEDEEGGDAMRPGTLAAVAAVGACLLAGCNDVEEGDVYTKSEVDVLVASLQAKIAAQQVSIDAHYAKLAAVSIENGGDDFVFTGVNVHVRSGSGSTDGSVNGRGNLIVGYDEYRGSGDDKSGSHNLVVGRHNNYSSYGSLVAGSWNTASGLYASVTGGSRNTASGNWASVSGGYTNTASNSHASVSGGYTNTASGPDASVSGGYHNSADSSYASVSGGRDNIASGQCSSVSGGWTNTASGQYASVSGGYMNTASYTGTSVSGGRFNEAGDTMAPSGFYSHVCGGFNNAATANDENVP